MELPKVDLKKERSLRFNIDMNIEGLLAGVIIFGIGILIGLIV